MLGAFERDGAPRQSGGTPPHSRLDCIPLDLRPTLFVHPASSPRSPVVPQSTAPSALKQPLSAVVAFQILGDTIGLSILFRLILYAGF